MPAPHFFKKLAAMKRKKDSPPDELMHSTVCPLQAACVPPSKRRIEDAVHRTSKLTYCTALLIDAHLTRLCSEHRPLPQINRDFIYHASGRRCVRLPWQLSPDSVPKRPSRFWARGLPCDPNQPYGSIAAARSRAAARTTSQRIVWLDS